MSVPGREQYHSILSKDAYNEYYYRNNYLYCRRDTVPVSMLSPRQGIPIRVAAAAEFRTLLERHREEGVRWAFHPVSNAPDVFILSGLMREPQAPKGSGAQALREICILADRHGICLRSWTNVSKLDSFYKRFGFVKASYGYADGTLFFMREPFREVIVEERRGWAMATLRAVLRKFSLR